MTATRSSVKRSSVENGIAGEGRPEMIPGIEPGEEFQVVEDDEPIPLFAGDSSP